MSWTRREKGGNKAEGGDPFHLDLDTSLAPKEDYQMAGLLSVPPGLSPRANLDEGGSMERLSVSFGTKFTLTIPSPTTMDGPAPIAISNLKRDHHAAGHTDLSSDQLGESGSMPAFHKSRSHGYIDKRVALYKTEICRTFEETGTCKYGIKCQFAHSEAERRPAPRHPRYKTEICRTYWDQGTCPYGKRCCFIHNETEQFLSKNTPKLSASPGGEERSSNSATSTEAVPIMVMHSPPTASQSRLLSRLHCWPSSTSNVPNGIPCKTATPQHLKLSSSPVFAISKSWTDPFQSHSSSTPSATIKSSLFSTQQRLMHDDPPKGAESHERQADAEAVDDLWDERQTFQHLKSDMLRLIGE